MPDGSNLIIGQVNTGDATTRLDRDGTAVNAAFDVVNLNGTGVRGKGSGANSGVIGESAAGYGVVGDATSGTAVLANSTDGTGVEAKSATGTGVKSTSTSGVAVQAVSTNNHGVVAGSPSQAGVIGLSSTGVGAYGLSTSGVGTGGASTNREGVYGISTNAQGVRGHSTGAAGVLGTSVRGNGVEGSGAGNQSGVVGWSKTYRGVAGYSTDGAGVFGMSSTKQGVEGYSSASAGVVGWSQNGGGVMGSSTKGRGVSGLSRDSDGVYGQSDNAVGVGGVSFSTQPGMIGYSSAGIGVWGRGPKGWGVVGEGQHIGVHGASTTGVGVLGDASGGIGVHGTAIRGPAVKGDADWQNGFGVQGTGMWGVIGEGRAVGVKAKSDHYSILSESDGGLGVFAITKTGTAIDAWAQDAKGMAGSFNGKVNIYKDLYVGGATTMWNLKVQGDLDVFGNKHAAVKIRDGSYRRLYAMESPESWFEDFGRGRLARGRAKVALERTFAQVARTDDYHVFLTLEDPCNGMYVARRTRTGFEIREVGEGRSNAAFSYRVVARRADIAGRRFQKIAPPPRAPRPIASLDLLERRGPRPTRTRLARLSKAPITRERLAPARPPAMPAAPAISAARLPEPPDALHAPAAAPRTGRKRFGRAS